MEQAERLIDQAAALQRRFENVLEASGLTLESLRELAERIRRKLPPAELRRVEEAKRALTPQPRRRPGTSDLVLPIGIRS